MSDPLATMTPEPSDNPEQHAPPSAVIFDAPTADDPTFMALALDQARLARDLDEVPVGAVIVIDGRVVGAGHNQVRTLGDPTAHAEILALREACRATGDGRLPGAVVYTTLEPCFMCAGALTHARVARVVWGARDPKFGGCVSLGHTLQHPRANHRAACTEGVGKDDARELLQTFFRSKRRVGEADASDS